MHAKERLMKWLGVATMAGVAFAGTVNGQEGEYTAARGWYVGMAGGLTSIEIPSQNIQLEGISFEGIQADDSDMGTYVYTGYWITDHVGLELGYKNFGSVEALFDYYDPRSGERGTGESDVGVEGLNVSLQLGVDIDRVRLFGRAGVLSWDTNYDTRFDSLGGETVRRDFSEDGTGPILGIGASWNFARGWNLRADVSYSEIDIADAWFYGLGLEYDFNYLFREAVRRY